MEGVKEAIEKYYDIEGDFYFSLNAMVDIKEWANDPDDVLIGYQIYKNSIYLLQKTTFGGYIKVLSPTHTYVYDIHFYTAFDFDGSRTNYSKFEVLDDHIVLYGHVYFDLNNLLVFALDKPGGSNYPIYLRGALALTRSVKRITNSAWIVMDSIVSPEKRETVFYLYQRTSFMDCMDCDDKKRILKAMGFDKRADDLNCDMEEFRLPALYIEGDKNKKISTSKLSSVSVSQGMVDDGEDIVVTYDIKECLENFKKMSAVLNSKTFTDEVQNYFKQMSISCNPSILKVLVDYIVAFYKTKHLYENFLKDYYKDDVDYDAFYSQLDEVVKPIIRVVTGIITLSKDLNEALRGLKEIFRYSFFWGALYIKVYEDEFKDKDGNWKKINPYAKLSSVDFDAFYGAVVQSLDTDTTFNFPFPVRKIKISKSTNFSEDAYFYSLGPAGCLSKIEFHGLDINTVDAIVDIEMISEDKIYVWGWQDVNGASNIANHYMINTLYRPQYKMMIIELDLKTKKASIIYDFIIPKHWHPLDHRKMVVAINTDKDALFIRDYFISEIKDGKIKSVDYIEMKKPLNKQMAKLLNSTRSSYIAANINNVTYYLTGRLNFTTSPGFPASKLGPRDIGDKNVRIIFPYQIGVWL